MAVIDEAKVLKDCRDTLISHTRIEVPDVGLEEFFSTRQRLFGDAAEWGADDTCTRDQLCEEFVGWLTGETSPSAPYDDAKHALMDEMDERARTAARNRGWLVWPEDSWAWGEDGEPYLTARTADGSEAPRVHCEIPREGPGDPYVRYLIPGDGERTRIFRETGEDPGPQDVYEPPAPEPPVAPEVKLGKLMAEALDAMPPQAAYVLVSRFSKSADGSVPSHEDIAGNLGITADRVRAIEEEGLTFLGAVLNEEADEEAVSSLLAAAGKEEGDE